MQINVKWIIKGSLHWKQTGLWYFGTLTARWSSEPCIVMQSMLIWMVLDGELPVEPSEKFKSSMGWTVWNADLRKNKKIPKEGFWGNFQQNNSAKCFCSVSIPMCNWNYRHCVCFLWVMCLCNCTYWSSISSSWLKTSGPRMSVPCELGLWDMEAKKDPSAHERHAAGSRNLLKNNVHIKYYLLKKT